MYPLPLFSLLNIDRDTYGTMLEELCRSAPEEFQKAVTPENEALSSFFGKLFRLPDELLCFRSHVSTMLDFYFEPLRRRNAEHYAVGVYRFFSDAAAQEALRAVLPPYPTAAERIRCAVLNPDRAGRNEAHLQAGRCAQQAGGPGQQDAGADRIRKHLQPFEKAEGTREDFNR